MKRILLCLAAVLYACFPGSAQPWSDFDFADTASLARQLRELQVSLAAPNPERVREALPAAWRVQTADGDYSISTARLRGFLGSLVVERSANMARPARHTARSL